MCQKKFLLAQLFCWLVSDLLKPNLTILLSLHFTAHWKMSRVHITFCRCASLSKAAEPIKYFHTAYGLLLKGSFNHVISWSPHLQFCIKFGTRALFFTLTLWMQCTTNIFLYLPWLHQSEWLQWGGAVGHKVLEKWTQFGHFFLLVWWISSFVHNLNSCWAVLANITDQCTTNITVCLQCGTEWPPWVLADCGHGGSCPDISE